MESLPTDDDYKQMARDINKVLKPVENEMRKIEGLIAFGIGISREDFRKVVITTMISNKLTIHEHQEVLYKILNLDGITDENLEFSIEPMQRKGKRTSFDGERIQHER